MAAPPGAAPDEDETAAGDAVPVAAGAEAGALAGADAVADAAALLLAGPAAAAELLDELHAVSSNAVAASSVPAAAVRPLRLVKVSMDSNPSNFISRLCEPRHRLRRRAWPHGWNQLGPGSSTTARSE
jgi:hypothetical protein